MNRTPIKRDPEKVAEWQQRSRKPIPPVSPRRKQAIAAGAVRAAARETTGFSRAVKLGVRKRAGGGFIEDALCESCGVWLGRYGGEVQHRAARGAGGCADEVIGGYANAALLCGHGAAPIRSGCHGECEDRKPRMAMDAGGFWIGHGTTPEYDPRNVSVLLRSPHGSGIKVWLAADGKGPDGTGYLFEPPEGAVAA